MKIAFRKSKLLTVAVAVGAFIASATPLLADYSYYWPTPISHHIQPLYTSHGQCNNDHPNVGCEFFGNVCGQDYYATRSVGEAAFGFLNEGYTLEVVTRGTSETICEFSR